MNQELVPDSLWREVRPLLPAHRSHPKGGNDFADDRRCLRGIVFVCKTGLRWQDLPTEVFGVSGSTCWRRFRDWTRAGVFERLHRRLLDRLGQSEQVDQLAGVIDSASVRAEKGGSTPGPTPRIEPKTAASAT